MRLDYPAVVLPCLAYWQLGKAVRVFSDFLLDHFHLVRRQLQIEALRYHFRLLARLLSILTLLIRFLVG